VGVSESEMEAQMDLEDRPKVEEADSDTSLVNQGSDPNIDSPETKQEMIPPLKGLQAVDSNASHFESQKSTDFGPEKDPKALDIELDALRKDLKALDMETKTLYQKFLALQEERKHLVSLVEKRAALQAKSA